MEKKKKWSSYNSKTKVNLEGIVVVDNGKIGSNYFVIMGIKKEVLFKNRVTFNKLEEIINQWILMHKFLINSFVQFH